MRLFIAALCCFIGCLPADARLAVEPDGDAVAVQSEGHETPVRSYAEAVASLAGERKRLAGSRSPGQSISAETVKVVFDALRKDLIRAWIGTPWDFNGTSETPGQGTIACGYLVSTVLRDAGFRVQRRRLAQQPSERIIQTLAPEDEIRRFSDPEIDDVLAHVAEQGDGLYLVGLDYHVGFLVRHEARTEFCHSSYLPPGGAVCSDPRRDAAFVSRYYVVGRLLSEKMMRAWLSEAAIPTRVQ